MIFVWSLTFKFIKLLNNLHLTDHCVLFCDTAFRLSWSISGRYCFIKKIRKNLLVTYWDHSTWKPTAEIHVFICGSLWSPSQGALWFNSSSSLYSNSGYLFQTGSKGFGVCGLHSCSECVGHIFYIYVDFPVSFPNRLHLHQKVLLQK